MSNKDRKMLLRDFTHGSLVFAWDVADGGYSLYDAISVDKEPSYDIYRVPCNVKDVGNIWNPFGNVARTLDEWIDRRPPWLVPQGKEYWDYSPLSKPTLHRRFGALGQSEKAILDFANKYGLLGHDIALWLEDGVQGNEIPHVFDKQQTTRATLGESLSRWKDEIESMALFLAIWDLVRHKEFGKLGQIIRWRNAEDVAVVIIGKYEKGRYEFSLNKPDTEVLKIDYLANRRDNVNVELLDRWRMGDVLEPALFYVCRKVNEKLNGQVAPQLFRWDAKMYLCPETLLSAMWLMFMWEITGEVRVIRCPSCGFWAEQMDRRQDYCSNACKQRAYRERQKAKRAK